MIPGIPWIRIVLVGLAVLTVYLVITKAANFVDDYVAEKEQMRTELAASQIQVGELKSAKDSLEYKLQLEEEYSSKKAELLEATNSELMEARVKELEANNAFAVEKLSRVAGLGQRANQALTYRAEKATRKKLDQVEELSDWGDVYENTTDSINAEP